MNSKYSKYCIALRKDGKRCKKYSMNDSECCCVHSNHSEENIPGKYEIIEQKGWCVLYAMYFMFLLHICLFAYTINTFPFDP